MSTWTLIEKLQRAWQRFRVAERGNVVITFAMATIPMVGFVGAAVDYSHANSIKAALQAALDATALAMSKTAGKLNATDLQTKSDAYFRALFTRAGGNRRHDHHELQHKRRDHTSPSPPRRRWRRTS